MFVFFSYFSGSEWTMHQIWAAIHLVRVTTQKDNQSKNPWSGLQKRLWPKHIMRSANLTVVATNVLNEGTNHKQKQRKL